MNCRIRYKESFCEKLHIVTTLPLYVDLVAARFEIINKWECGVAGVLPWNNGKEVPRWGVAEILKMSPSTTGRCSRQTADQWERGTATRQPITQICSPGVVKLVYLQSRLGRTCEI